MILTIDQQHALEKGDAVPVTVEGRECVILLRSVYEQDYDHSEWTDEERDLLAAEVDAMLDDDMAIEDAES